MCYTDKFKSFMSCLFYCSVAVLYDIHCYFSDVSVSCENVTGSVGKEVNLTCSVSLQKTDCCIRKYMFKYPESFNDSEICRKELPKESCEQRNSFTCRYTPTTAVTAQFRFFVQPTCGSKRAEFTVDIPGTITVVYNSINVWNVFACLRSNWCMIMVSKK